MDLKHVILAGHTNCLKRRQEIPLRLIKILIHAILFLSIRPCVSYMKATDIQLFNQTGNKPRILRCNVMHAYLTITLIKMIVSKINYRMGVDVGIIENILLKNCIGT